MLCQNCGKNEVNFRYTQVINGVKKEMALCDKCAKILGLESLDFNMPINFSSFFGNFLTDAIDTEFMPSFNKTTTLQCKNCKMTYNEFIDNGKFGCSHCYNIFSDTLNSVLKNIHGSSIHTGRKSKFIKEESTYKPQNNKEIKQTKEINQKQEVSKQDEIAKLQEELKQAIKEERYEDAAKIRDQIKEK